MFHFSGPHHRVESGNTICSAVRQEILEQTGRNISYSHCQECQPVDCYFYLEDEEVALTSVNIIRNISILLPKELLPMSDL